MTLDERGQGNPSIRVAVITLRNLVGVLNCCCGGSVSECRAPLTVGQI